jgi:hypothetical protein
MRRWWSGYPSCLPSVRSHKSAHIELRPHYFSEPPKISQLSRTSLHAKPHVPDSCRRASSTNTEPECTNRTDSHFRSRDHALLAVSHCVSQGIADLHLGRLAYALRLQATCAGVCCVSALSLRVGAECARRLPISAVSPSAPPYILRKLRIDRYMCGYACVN